jgi:hypothetical protein
MNNQDSAISMLAMGAEADWAWVRDELAFAWRSAQDEALSTYRAWSESPGRAAYVVYRAAQDRADQAQDALAAHRRPGLSGRSADRAFTEVEPVVKTQLDTIKAAPLLRSPSSGRRAA